MIAGYRGLKAYAVNAESRHYEKSSARKSRRLDTYGFCRLRCKPIAVRSAEGMRGAGVERRRASNCDTTNMMDATHRDAHRFDREFDRFDSVLPRPVKSQSQDGSAVYYNLTDLTDSLSRGTCAREAFPSTLSLSLPRERIGQISQIGKNPFAVLRFSFDSAQSTGVKRRSKLGQTGGVAA